jgi:hypothetical protein
MFDILKKYKDTNHFFFTPTDSLAKVCNAPVDKAGVYLVYALKKGKIELVYIGRSGQINKDGSLFIRKGGLKDRIVNGKRDGILRKNFWREEMLKQGIEALDIYWHVTCDQKIADCPRSIEGNMLDVYKSIYGQKPRWNRA